MVAGEQANAAGLAAMIQDIVNGNCDGQARTLLTDSCLLGLGKPQGGVRPIAIGEVLLRAAGALVVKHHLVELRRIFAGVQFGLNHEAGRGCVR
jgi:hypothetical protein